MSYCFRYRVRMLTAIRFPEGSTSDIAFDGHLLKVSEQSGNWITFTSCVFDSEDEAKRAGERFGRYLLLSGALQGWGVDLGFNKKMLQFSEHLRQTMQYVDGRAVDTEIHGLGIYTSDLPIFISLNAHGKVSVSSDTFAKELSGFPSDFRLNEEQERCVRLLNDAAYLGRPEPRFVLCISAIEALCPRVNRNEAEIHVFQHVINSVYDLNANESAKQKVRQILISQQKYESVRQSLIEKITSLLGCEEAAEFDKLYRRRSKYLHEGLGSGELADAAGKAQALARELLMADLKL